MTKQGRLIEEQLIQPLVEKADELFDVRSERMKLTKREHELATQIQEIMHEHKLKTYKYEDVEIFLEVVEEKVKVRKVPKPKLEEDQDIDPDTIPDAPVYPPSGDDVNHNKTNVEAVKRMKKRPRSGKRGMIRQ